jgi:hypothetical protein
MADHAVTKTKHVGVPALPPDSENEALIDAGKTFRITLIGALLFGLASLFIILRTRMG